MRTDDVEMQDVRDRIARNKKNVEDAFALANARIRERDAEIKRLRLSLRAIQDICFRDQVTHGLGGNITDLRTEIYSAISKALGDQP